MYMFDNLDIFKSDMNAANYVIQNILDYLHEKSNGQINFTASNVRRRRIDTNNAYYTFTLDDNNGLVMQKLGIYLRNDGDGWYDATEIYAIDDQFEEIWDNYCELSYEY